MATQTTFAQEGTFLSERHSDVPAQLHVPDHGACTAVNDVLARVGDKWTMRVIMALGAGPLCRDAGFAQVMADLPVFIRQSHAERDQAAHGQSVLNHESAPWAL